MATDEVKRFLGAVAHDSVVNDRVRAAVATSTDHVAAIGAVGRSAGYNFRDDELTAALQDMARELTDAELSHVAGGVGGGQLAAFAHGGAISPHLLQMLFDKG